MQPHVHEQGRETKLSEEQLEQVRAALIEESDITLLDLIAKLKLPINASALGDSFGKWDSD